MRLFKFNLETVLRHRETIETLRQQEFAVAQQQVDAVRARIAKLHEEFGAAVSARPDGKAGEAFDAILIVNRERYLETLQAAIASHERRAAACQVVLAEKRAALVKARQAREAVSRLHDRHLQTHTALMQRMAQDALDEMATLRHTRAAQDDARNWQDEQKNEQREAA